MSENLKCKTPVEKKKGGAPMGNQYWKARSSHGRRPKYRTPDHLWAACCEYFEWVVDNPIQEEQVFTYRGNIIKANLNKMRPMSLAGLCLFLGIAFETWCCWRKKRNDLSDIIGKVDGVIWDYQFTGAAVNLLNPRIIARQLAFRNKRDRILGNKNGEQLNTAADTVPRMTYEEASSNYAKVMKKSAS